MNMTEFTDVFQYAGHAEREFYKETKHERISTTFFDLSFAEWHGEKYLRETYAQIWHKCKNDVRLYADLAYCVKYKALKTYNNFEVKLAKIYNDLWCNMDEMSTLLFVFGTMELGYYENHKWDID